MTRRTILLSVDSSLLVEIDGVARRVHREDILAGGINTDDKRGLDERAIHALRSRADGGPIPRM